MRLTKFQYEEILLRRNKPAATGGLHGDMREVGSGGLHEQIIDYCNAQWPQWKFIHSRTDKRSTVEIGSHDFTIFMPGGRILCVECKSRFGKLTTSQMSWTMQMNALGHAVHVVRSLDEFKACAIA